MKEEDFQKLENPSYDLEKEEDEGKAQLKEIYDNLINILKNYLDMKEEYYNIVALWIIGTYIHDKFPSFPFLFFNAIKSSGKTRTINLITTLSKEGTMLNSLTEAVLFRTKGTLAIDEYEGISRKGNENLRELLNSCYKRGAKVKRMKQQKTIMGSEQVVEEFEVYRPVVMANIWGMEEVLGDRCITLILDKSHRTEVTNLLEIFNEDVMIHDTKILLNQCSLCSSVVSGETYIAWNIFINNNYTNYTNYIHYTNYTNYTSLFKMIKDMGLNGRELELSFPLCLISSAISTGNEGVSTGNDGVVSDLLKKTTLTLKQIFQDKKEEEIVENKDINLIEFTATRLHNENFDSINNLVREFKESFGFTEEWINTKWMGRALKRLNLILTKRRTGRGVEVILDTEKAQNKIKMFK